MVDSFQCRQWLSSNKINLNIKLNINAKLLTVFEEKLVSSEILQLFKEAESNHIWHGDVKYAGLFESWRTLKKLCVGSRIEMDSIRSNSSLASDHSYPEDQQIPNVNNDEVSNVVSEATNDDVMPEPTDIVPEASDSIPDTLGCSENQVIVDTVDDNVVDISYSANSIIEQRAQVDFPVTDSKIELYDELGNRITATVITVINDDETMENSINTSTLDCMNSSNKDEIQEDSHNSVTAAVNMTTSEVTLVKSSPDFRSSILRENNSLNHMKIDNSHLCITEESNSSAYLAESTADAHVPTSKSKEFFSVPTFTPKSKKKASPANTPPVSVVDDLLAVLQQKETEKKEKEQQILLNKQERERAKVIREKETSMVKQYNKTKKKNLQKKKELKSKIQSLKKALKSETKENFAQLSDGLNNTNIELTALENSIAKDEMEFLQTKIKIKQEIL